jgi:regulator of nonsense transcripts 1
MLSNQTLRFAGVLRMVPITTLVVDEASQIEIGDYIPVFTNFVSTIRKVCFIGDDKQLPPHGQEDIPSLQSIFELGNLRELALFLDTQYRMPPQIGGFISHAIYDDKLQSFSDHPIKNSTLACRFIDIVGGREHLHEKSYMNELELKAVLRIARQFEAEEKSYRIITPYDAQRTFIENGLKEEELSWEDKCFNVDSFQGNEDDYIIISLVRSQALGFLKNLRRTNVMLTRCKRGMFICSSRAFLKGPGSKSLVGKMLKHVGEEGWLELADLEAGKY